MSTTLMYDDAWADLIGNCFVLGVANAKGEYVITLGGTRWRLSGHKRLFDMSERHLRNQKIR